MLKIFTGYICISKLYKTNTHTHTHVRIDTSEQTEIDNKLTMLNTITTEIISIV